MLPGERLVQGPQTRAPLAHGRTIREARWRWPAPPHDGCSGFLGLPLDSLLQQPEAVSGERVVVFLLGPWVAWWLGTSCDRGPFGDVESSLHHYMNWELEGGCVSSLMVPIGSLQEEVGTCASVPCGPPGTNRTALNQDVGSGSHTALSWGTWRWRVSWREPSDLKAPGVS